MFCLKALGYLDLILSCQHIVHHQWSSDSTGALSKERYSTRHFLPKNASLLMRNSIPRSPWRKDVEKTNINVINQVEEFVLYYYRWSIKNRLILFSKLKNELQLTKGCAERITLLKILIFFLESRLIPQNDNLKTKVLRSLCRRTKYVNCRIRKKSIPIPLSVNFDLQFF